MPNIIMADQPGGVAISDSGTFTVSSNVTEVEITHNLNSTDIFGVIWAEPDENNEVVAVRGYQLLCSPFTTRLFADEVFTGKTLVSNYTSSETKTASYSARNSRLQATKSAWTNDAAAWKTEGIINVWTTNVTSNSFVLHATSNNGPYFGRVTYRWKIWKIEGALQ